MSQSAILMLIVVCLVWLIEVLKLLRYVSPAIYEIHN
jgi:hypothetical protein